MLRKTLSVLLAIAMLCSLIPSAVFAADDADAVIGGADGATDIVLEDTIVVDEEAEDLEAVAMAAEHDFVTSAFEDLGVKMPEKIANYNYTAADDKAQVAAKEDLPQGAITYLLIDSDAEGKSNFDVTLPSGISLKTPAGNDINPWSDGNTRRTGTGGEASASTHTAYIVVPESVGASGKPFQVVTMNIRTAEPENVAVPGRYEFAGRGMKVWIDDEPVTVDLENGHDVFGNIRSTAEYKKMTNWQLKKSGSSYYIWEWGATVNLTPGVHKIVYKPNGSGVGGRTPGLIITDSLGYDWTKISPFPGEGYTFGNAATSVANMREDFANSFGAAGLMDFTAPVMGEGEVAVEPDAVTAAVSWPAATDGESGYGDAYIGYKVECNGNVRYTTNTQIIVTGLKLNTEYTVSVTPIDAVGNVGEAISAKFKTLEFAAYPFFADGKIESVLKDNATEYERTKTLSIKWSPAEYSDMKNISYNVYLVGEDGEKLVIENTSKTTGIIKDLEANTAYTVKVVILLNGTEVEEPAAAMTAEFSTLPESVPEFEAAAFTSTITDATNVDELPISWTPVAYDGDKNVSYVLYLNGDKVAEGITTTAYTFTGLTPATEYEVKVAVALDGTAALDGEGQDAKPIEISANMYTPSAKPEVLSAEATTDSATLTVANCYENYKFTYTVVANGSEVKADVNGSEITVNGLIDGIEQNILVRAVATGADGSKYIVIYPMAKVTTQQGSSEPTFTLKCPVPLCYDTINEKNSKVENPTWPTKVGDGQGGWTGDGVWSSQSGSVAGGTITIPSTGNYYLVARTFVYEGQANRHFTATVNNNNLGGYQFGEGKAGWQIDYAPTPIHLNEGDKATIRCQHSGGVIRVDFVALIPAANETALKGILDGLKNMTDVLNLSKPTDYLLNGAVQAQAIGLDKILVTWEPTFIAADDPNVKYALYLNDKLVETVGADVRRYTFENDVLLGANNVEVRALSDKDEKGSATTSVVIKNKIDIVATQNGNSVSIALTNPSSSESKRLAVVVATYKDNRIVQKSFEKVELIPGTTVVNCTVPAALIGQTSTLDPEAKQTKIFVLDLDDNYAPMTVTFAK